MQLRIVGLVAAALAGLPGLAQGITEAELRAKIDRAIQVVKATPTNSTFAAALIHFKRQGYFIDEVFYGKNDRFNGMVMWLKGGDPDVILYSTFEGSNKAASKKVGRKLPYTTGWKTGKNRLGPQQTQILESAQSAFKLTSIGIKIPPTYSDPVTRNAVVNFGSLVIGHLSAKYGQPTSKQFVWEKNGVGPKDGWNAVWTKKGVRFEGYTATKDRQEIWFSAPIK